MSTPFFRVRPRNFAHVLSVPLPSLTNIYFLFFRQIFGFLFFAGYLGIKRPHIFGEKKIKKTTKHSERLGKGTLNTCAKFQGLTLENGVAIWTFVRLSAKITAWHRNYLV